MKALKVDKSSGMKRRKSLLPACLNDEGSQEEEQSKTRICLASGEKCMEMSSVEGVATAVTGMKRRKSLLPACLNDEGSQEEEQSKTRICLASGEKCMEMSSVEGVATAVTGMKRRKSLLPACLNDEGSQEEEQSKTRICLASGEKCMEMSSVDGVATAVTGMKRRKSLLPACLNDEGSQEEEQSKTRICLASGEKCMEMSSVEGVATAVTGMKRRKSLLPACLNDEGSQEEEQSKTRICLASGEKCMEMSSVDGVATAVTGMKRRKSLLPACLNDEGSQEEEQSKTRICLASGEKCMEMSSVDGVATAVTGMKRRKSLLPACLNDEGSQEEEQSKTRICIASGEKCMEMSSVDGVATAVTGLEMEVGRSQMLSLLQTPYGDSSLLQSIHRNPSKTRQMKAESPADTHRSGGRCGDDLTVCGGVEQNPGPRNVKMPLPDDYYSASSDHQKNRIRRCVVCFRQMPKLMWATSIKKYREMYLPKNKPILSLLQQLFPEYNPWLISEPLSLCLTCQASVHDAVLGATSSSSGSKLFNLTPHFQTLLSAAKQRTESASRAPLINCNGESCHICVGLVKRYPRQVSAPHPDEVSSLKIRKRTVVTSTIADDSADAKRYLDTTVFLAMQAEMSSRACAIAKAEDGQCALALQDESLISCRSGSKLKKAASAANAFQTDLNVAPCEFASDGGFYNVCNSTTSQSTTTSSQSTTTTLQSPTTTSQSTATTSQFHNDQAEFVRKCTWLHGKKNPLRKDNVELPSVPHPKEPHPNVPRQNVPRPNIPHPNVPHPNVPHPNVPHPNVPRPNVPHPESCEATRSICLTSRHESEEMLVDSVAENEAFQTHFNVAPCKFASNGGFDNVRNPTTSRDTTTTSQATTTTSQYYSYQKPLRKDNVEHPSVPHPNVPHPYVPQESLEELCEAMRSMCLTSGHKSAEMLGDSAAENEAFQTHFNVAPCEFASDGGLYNVHNSFNFAIHNYYFAFYNDGGFYNFRNSTTSQDTSTTSQAATTTSQSATTTSQFHNDQAEFVGKCAKLHGKKGKARRKKDRFMKQNDLEEVCEAMRSICLTSGKVLVDSVGQTDKEKVIWTLMNAPYGGPTLFKILHPKSSKTRQMMRPDFALLKPSKHRLTFRPAVRLRPRPLTLADRRKPSQPAEWETYFIPRLKNKETNIFKKRTFISSSPMTNDSPSKATWVKQNNKEANIFKKGTFISSSPMTNDSPSKATRVKQKNKEANIFKKGTFISSSPMTNDSPSKATRVKQKNKEANIFKKGTFISSSPMTNDSPSKATRVKQKNKEANIFKKGTFISSSPMTNDSPSKATRVKQKNKEANIFKKGTFISSSPMTNDSPSKATRVNNESPNDNNAMEAKSEETLGSSPLSTSLYSTCQYFAKMYDSGAKWIQKNVIRKARTVLCPYSR
uniref:uncharacterized protein n=1 Tax=Myxine glutinosa TaxID=7769 RepID=UPI00358EA5FC